jgi:geranylgeranyl pyrophosphate synthase
VTYPIYLYFCKCNPQEKLSFLRVFGKNIDFDYDYFKNSFISKGVYKECRSRINRLILEANQLLHKLPNTENKKLLKKWANYHKNI